MLIWRGQQERPGHPLTTHRALCSCFIPKKDELGLGEQIHLPAKTLLRFTSCANILARSCQQNETSLKKRLRCDIPSETGTDHIAYMPDEQIDARLEETQAQINAMPTPLANFLPGNGGPYTTPEDNPTCTTAHGAIFC